METTACLIELQKKLYSISTTVYSCPHSHYIKLLKIQTLADNIHVLLNSDQDSAVCIFCVRLENGPIWELCNRTSNFQGKYIIFSAR